ncbi:MAG: hypothetical protein ACLPHP_12645 [Candidatus Sulfotelmatobacter sp.]
MGDLIGDFLEPLLEIAGEWLVVRVCDLIVAGWHAVQALLSQLFF